LLARFLDYLIGGYFDALLAFWWTGRYQFIQRTQISVFGQGK